MGDLDPDELDIGSPFRTIVVGSASGGNMPFCAILQSWHPDFSPV